MTVRVKNDTNDTYMYIKILLIWTKCKTFIIVTGCTKTVEEIRKIICKSDDVSTFRKRQKAIMV